MVTYVVVKHDYVLNAAARNTPYIKVVCNKCPAVILWFHYNILLHRMFRFIVPTILISSSFWFGLSHTLIYIV